LEAIKKKISLIDGSESAAYLTNKAARDNDLRNPLKFETLRKLLVS